MATKRPRRPRTKPLGYLTKPGTERRPYGMTKYEAKQAQTERGLKARIFELEEQLTSERLRANTFEELNRVQTDVPISALWQICSTPVATLVEAGIDVSLVTEVSEWLVRRTRGAALADAGTQAREALKRHTTKAKKAP